MRFQVSPSARATLRRRSRSTPGSPVAVSKSIFWIARRCARSSLAFSCSTAYASLVRQSLRGDRERRGVSSLICCWAATCPVERWTRGRA